ncbi:MAG: hypothetical protein MGG37_21180 [Trichodesmium sp. MAG_R01]|nr:hypothetical protein [Trichodesmium sp. MAG_R01]
MDLTIYISSLAGSWETRELGNLGIRNLGVWEFGSLGVGSFGTGKVWEFRSLGIR